MAFTDLIGLIGYMGLTGAFFLCAVIILLTATLHIRSNAEIEKLARTLTHTQTALLGIAFIALAVLLQMGSFEYEQVFNAVEIRMHWTERIGGLWSGQASSLLFWSLVMSAAASISIPIARRLPHPGYTRTVLLILEATMLFFLVPDVFISNPFMKIWILPTGDITAAVFPPAKASLLVAVDGQGMNPQLRHPAMLLHPPTLYFGLIGFFFPYAFALAALVNRDDMHSWIQPIFPIALASWAFLTIGMLLGSWWAYTILGWGGYWGWDAVEISGLIPWLLSFGLMHSLRLKLRGRPFKRWVYVFSFAIVILILLGIFITRSGILESVHAYASGAIGHVLSILIVFHVSIVLFFVITRRKLLSEQMDKNKANFQEKLFRWFNLCLIGLVLIYLFGQTLPLTSQLLTGEKISFTPDNYEKASAPLLLLFVIIMALCPLTDAKAKYFSDFSHRLPALVACSAVFPISALFFSEFSATVMIGFWATGFLFLSWLSVLIRDHLLPMISKKGSRKCKASFGMRLIHLGLAVMAMGIMGVEVLTRSYDQRMTPGEVVRLSSNTFLLAARDEQINENGDVVFDEKITLTKPTGLTQDLIATIIHISKTGSLFATPAIAPGFLNDVQVVLKEIPPSPTGAAEFRITFFPLMSWIWTGGAFMAAGGFVSLAGGRRKA